MKKKNVYLLENNIYLLRAEKRMTQQDLADCVEVSRQTINSVEKNKYNPSLLLSFRIAAVFEKEINEVFKFRREDWLIVILSNFYSFGIIIVGLVFVIVYFLAMKNIGETDERTTIIRLKINNSQYYTLIVCILITLTLDGYLNYPHTLLRNLLISSIVLSVGVGAVSALINRFRY